MTRLINYYALLGLTPEASEDAIRSAYRKLALRYHPDRSTDPNAGAKFSLIAEAYDVLSDAEKRRAFDERRRLESELEKTQSIPPASEPKPAPTDAVSDFVRHTFTESAANEWEWQQFLKNKGLKP